MSNINNFPIDDSLKHRITMLVAGELTFIGISMGLSQREQFSKHSAGELIEKVLDAIVEWERKNSN